MRINIKELKIKLIKLHLHVVFKPEVDTHDRF